MKLQDIIRNVYYEPSLITPAAHASIRCLLESRLGESALEDQPAAAQFQPQAAKRQAKVCGEVVDLPSMVIDDGIAHIPVAGVIGAKLSDFSRWAGAVDVSEIAADLDEAEANPKVRGIILDCDTPGGMVLGTPELAARIAQVTKTIYAFTDGMIASAGYWLAAGTDGIFSTLTASIGSIGVYLPWIDQSAAFQARGLRVELIKAGKLKGMGFPGTVLSEEQRAHLQERVNDIYDMFTAHVLAHRADVTEDTMQGQTFLARQAASRGLIDAIVTNKAEVVSLFE